VDSERPPGGSAKSEAQHYRQDPRALSWSRVGMWSGGAEVGVPDRPDRSRGRRGGWGGVPTSLPCVPLLTNFRTY
jgi:hypothetical protein